jgi:NADPH:quinone reductase
MRAVLCREFGSTDKLSVEEVAAPPLAAGNVRISVAAAGVNFADALMISGQYQVKPPLPFTPGLEVAGTVVEVASDVAGLAPGTRVMGIGEWGAFAEDAVIPAANVFQIPDKMDFTVAAGFAVAYGTAYGALEWRARLKKEEIVLVLGAGGGVGLASVEVAKAMGALVIAAASGPEKLALAKARNADHLIDYTKENVRDRVREIAGARGVDVVIDPVGGEAFDAALRVIGWEGRVVVIGFAGGKIQQVPANVVLVKNFDVIGYYWGSYLKRKPAQIRQSYEELFRWFNNGRLKPHISNILSLEQAGAGLEMLIHRQATGKIVLTPGLK